MVGRFSIAALVLLSSCIPTQARDNLAGKATKTSFQVKDGKDVAAFSGEPTELYYHYHSGGMTVQHESYLDILKKKLFEALAGILLVVCAFPLLYFNEKRQAHMERIFTYGEAIVKADVPSAPLDNNNEGCLVNVQGETRTDEELRDDASGLTFQNCAHLSSSAEMYQWVQLEQSEERDTLDGGKEKITTYNYECQWNATEENSSQFNEPAGHENPPFYAKGCAKTASQVSFGDYALTSELITQMRSYKDVVEPNQLEMGGRVFMRQGECWATGNLNEPQVGDMKYTIQKVECGPATVLSLQKDNSFVPLTIDMVPSGGCCGGGGGSTGDKVELSEPLLGGKKSDPEINGLCSCIGAMVEAGESLNQLAEEHLSPSEMFNRAKAMQNCIRLSLKIAGFLLFYFGFYMQFAFFPAFFRIIPFVGTWIEYFGQWIASCAAFFLAIFHWCLVVGIAWLVVRPVKGILLITVAVAAIMLPTILSHQGTPMP